MGVYGAKATKKVLSTGRVQSILFGEKRIINKMDKEVPFQ